MHAAHLLPLALSIVTLAGRAQTGPFLTNDAAYAMNVCTDTSFVLSAGIGDVNDLNTTNRGCLLTGEQNGTWCFVRVVTAGTVAFTLQAVPSADLDFAVWGPFAAPPSIITTNPVRCSWSALNGATGLNATAVDLSEVAGGDGWVRYLDVLADEVYLMYVTYFSENGGTISLTWDLGAGASFDCLTPPMAAFTASAGTITPGGSVNFIDQSQVFPYAWEWSFPGGSPATSTERDPGNVLYTEPGCHDVGLTVHNAAGSDAVTTTCQVIVDVNTTVGASMEDRLHIQVLDGSIAVRHDNGEPFTAVLFDMQGRMIQGAQATGNLLLNGLRPGPVLLRINGSDGVLVREMVVP